LRRAVSILEKAASTFTPHVGQLAAAEALPMDPILFAADMLSCYKE
jgi:hypothetical protein